MFSKSLTFAIFAVVAACANAQVLVQNQERIEDYPTEISYSYKTIQYTGPNVTVTCSTPTKACADLIAEAAIYENFTDYPATTKPYTTIQYTGTNITISCSTTAPWLCKKIFTKVVADEFEELLKKELK